MKLRRILAPVLALALAAVLFVLAPGGARAGSDDRWDLCLNVYEHVRVRIQGDDGYDATWSGSPYGFPQYVGSGNADPHWFADGTKVTLTILPDEGYEGYLFTGEEAFTGTYTFEAHAVNYWSVYGVMPVQAEDHPRVIFSGSADKAVTVGKNQSSGSGFFSVDVRFTGDASISGKSRMWTKQNFSVSGDTDKFDVTTCVPGCIQAECGTTAFRFSPREDLAPGTYQLTFGFTDRPLFADAGCTFTYTKLDVDLDTEGLIDLYGDGSRYALPGGRVGQAYGPLTLKALGSTTDTFTTENCYVPEGLTLTDNGNGTATVSGTPTEYGEFGFNFAQLHGEAALYHQLMIRIFPAEDPVLYVTKDNLMSCGGTAWKDTALPPACEGEYYDSNVYLDTEGVTLYPAYMSTVAFSEGAPREWAETEVTGLGLTASTLERGDYSFEAWSEYRDFDGRAVARSDPRAFTLHVSGRPVISEAVEYTGGSAAKMYFGNQLRTAYKGEAYSATLSAESDLPVTFTVGEGSRLPAGLTLTDNGDGTALLSGTPAETGSMAFWLDAGNAAGTERKQIFLSICDKPVFTAEQGGEAVEKLCGGMVDAGYPYTELGFTKSAAVGSVRAEVKGSLPAELSTVSGGGVFLSGTPEKAGTYEFSVTAEHVDVDGVTVLFREARTFTVAIYKKLASEYEWGNTLEIPQLAVDGAMAPVDLSAYVTGGSGSFRYSVYPDHADDWYGGLCLDGDTGVISGAPEDLYADRSILIQVTDLETGFVLDVGVRFRGVVIDPPTLDQPDGRTFEGSLAVTVKPGRTPGLVYEYSTDGGGSWKALPDGGGLTLRDTTELLVRGFLPRLEKYTDTIRAGYTRLIAVTFDAGGGSGAMEKRLIPQRESFELPACAFAPPDSRSAFAGWEPVNGEEIYSQGTTWYAGETLSFREDAVLRAVWREKAELAVTDQGDGRLSCAVRAWITGSAKLVAVSCGRDGRILDVKLGDLALTAGQTASCSMILAKGTSYRVFLLDGADTMRPLAAMWQSGG